MGWAAGPNPAKTNASEIAATRQKRPTDRRLPPEPINLHDGLIDCPPRSRAVSRQEQHRRQRRAGQTGHRRAQGPQFHREHETRSHPAHLETLCVAFFKAQLCIAALPPKVRKLEIFLWQDLLLGDEEAAKVGLGHTLPGAAQSQKHLVVSFRKMWSLMITPPQTHTDAQTHTHTHKTKPIS